MKIEEKTILWKPVSEYTGGRVLATNGLDILVGELNPEGDCVSEDCSGIHLCGITHFAKIAGFFPELKESEDERIRNQIINFIEEYGNPIHCEWQKDWIAWLEKQGEFYTKRDVDNAYIEGMAFAKDELEKQNKQILANSAKTCKDEQQPTDNDMKELLHTEYEKGRADAIAEMQNLAWSEEDEEFLRRAINATKDAYPITAKWLKSLRPQNRWKPTELQMDVLLDEVNAWTKGCPKQKVLESLYNDLKKLMEE